ncbi:MAG TPA: type II toxin-antitoxin system MqsA family antitoxin [Polyangiaceae bacterium]
MPKVKTQPCPECGGVMRYEKHADVISYRGHEKTIQTLGWWCTKCGEGILTGKPLVAHARAFQSLKAEVDGVLGPKEVAKVREALGLSQRKAGELLGGGPRAFQKYESGSQIPSVPMSHLLTLLARDPRRLEELRGEPSSPAQRRSRGPRTVPSNRRKIVGKAVERRRTG